MSANDLPANDRIDNASLEQRKQAATPRGVGVLARFYVARAENAEMWDVEGNRYIDFGSGIAVVNTGHRHPRVIAAAKQQLDAFTHTAYQVVPYEPYVRLAERLNAITPGAHAKKTTFFSAGAEAIENAIKIARGATGRSAIIAFSGAFHGRTVMCLGLTGKVVPYKAGLGPFPSDIYHVPFPIELHGVAVEDTLRSLDFLFKADVDPARVAAIIIEPVQGEGGFYVAPPPLMRALREICDRHGILLIADEIQTGFARTGKMFAMDHYGVIPDIMTMAKGLAGGFPLSAVTGRAEVMDAPVPGSLGGTFAGSPMSVAAAHAVLDVIEDEKLCERAARLGVTLRERLDTVRSKVPQIAEVRGLGAMVSIELQQPGTRAPDPDFTRRVQQRAMEQGLLILTCGVYANVIRLLMPLTIPEPLFAQGLDILEGSLVQAAQS
ncbi:MAG TPA: 4-aminobutyrate--2-oxoglutarate transaminase [Haliangium sp.]|nr:4-aminobutyrate--2-oxoglutarate transaminase [Haliangium sp.]